MKITLFALAAAVGLAAPALAQEAALEVSTDESRVTAPVIPWEARWTGDADTPADADAASDASITRAADDYARGGPPTSIVPAAYSGVYGRSGGLR